MKEIKVIIQPHKLEKIREALTAIPGFPGMTVTRVEGCGPAWERGHQGANARAQLTDFSHKVRLEILAPDELVDTLIECIHRLAHTGQAGDGIVWVSGVERFIRLRLPWSA